MKDGTNLYHQRPYSSNQVQPNTSRGHYNNTSGHGALHIYIVQEYVSNKELLWRCLYWVIDCHDESVASYIMKELDLNEEKLKDLQLYKCKKPDEDQEVKYR